MINELKNDDIIQKAGGRFKLAALMQKRWIELMQGGRPMVEADNRNEMEIIATEIAEGKIAAEACEFIPLDRGSQSREKDD